MLTQINNAHLISPGLELRGASILIENDTIVEVSDSSQTKIKPDTVYDAEGKYLFPGFIDIHSHGANGADICAATVPSVERIAQQKLQEGVTTWLPTTLTLPQEQLLDIASACAQYSADTLYTKIPGLHLEGPFINPDMAGAQNPEFVRFANLEELSAIHSLFPVLLLSLAPCQKGAVEFISCAHKLGIHTSAAHTNANYAQILAAKQAGLSHLTHFGNAMSGLHHRELGTLGAGLIDNDLMLELICDGVHLSEDFVRMVFQLKSIDQLMLVTDSMSGSWLENGKCHLAGLEVTVKDAVARLARNQTLAGSNLRYNQGLKNVVEITRLALPEIIKTTSWNQAQSLGLEKVGKIEAGFIADLVIADESFSPVQTFVDGTARLNL